MTSFLLNIRIGNCTPTLRVFRYVWNLEKVVETKMLSRDEIDKNAFMV